MRIKIAYKLFIVNLTIILLLVLAMQVISYLSNKEVLNDFVDHIEGQMLEHIADEISTKYTQEQSWKVYQLNPRLWRETIFEQIIKYGALLKMPKDKANGLDKHFPKHKFMPFPPDGNHRPPAFKDLRKNRIPRPAQNFIDRISLFDAQKSAVIAATVHSDVIRSKEIKLNNTTIGWLHLNKRDFTVTTLASFYLTKQLENSYWVGTIGVLIAALFSYFLSKHITAPISSLSDTAHKIAKRDFTTRIKVTTNDEFKDLARSVNNISEKLAKYDEQQKQWLMDISHELRTPLTILDGELEALADGLTPFNSLTIQSLQEEVTLIMRLVDDLHELTVIDKLSFECQQENINITKLLSHQLDKFSCKYQKTNIELINKVPDNKTFVKGDHDRLCQVLQNILKNGLRYINTPGKLTITAETGQHSIQLVFHDTGPGVLKEALPKLFNRLYRTDESRNRRTGGAGLGLAICKNIIEAHGGSIFATLNHEGGLSIHIDLPINNQL